MLRSRHVAARGPLTPTRPSRSRPARAGAARARSAPCRFGRARAAGRARPADAGGTPRLRAARYVRRSFEEIGPIVGRSAEAARSSRAARAPRARWRVARPRFRPAARGRRRLHCGPTRRRVRRPARRPQSGSRGARGYRRRAAASPAARPNGPRARSSPDTSRRSRSPRSWMVPSASWWRRRDAWSPLSTSTIANGKITEMEIIGNPARLPELDVSTID